MNHPFKKKYLYKNKALSFINNTFTITYLTSISGAYKLDNPVGNCVLSGKLSFNY